MPLQSRSSSGGAPERLGRSEAFTPLWSGLGAPAKERCAVLFGGRAVEVEAESLAAEQRPPVSDHHGGLRNEISAPSAPSWAVLCLEARSQKKEVGALFETRKRKPPADLERRGPSSVCGAAGLWR